MNPVHLILIGDELLSGKRQDRHLRTLARGLERRGAKVDSCEIIRDEPEAMASAVARRLAPRALVLTTGGLGPTLDDLTRDGIAEATGVGLREDVDLWNDLRRLFERAGRTLSPSNKSQALVPVHGTYFPNHHGTAPGLVFSPPALEGCHVVALPGPPRELDPMWEKQALPFLAKTFSWPPPALEILLRFALVGESSIDEKMRPLLEPHPEIGLSSLIRIGRVDVGLSLPRDHPGGAALLREIAASTAGSFDRYLYSMTERFDLDPENAPAEELEETIQRLLRTRGERVALAESCTGGLVGKYLTDFSGSSDVFEGGIVSYQNELKRDLLGVPEQTLAEFGAVSEQTARKMVSGAIERTGADWGLSLTGIAGPGGGTETKPVGLVWIAVGRRGREVEAKAYEFPGDREMVRERAAVAALRMLWLNLREENA